MTESSYDADFDHPERSSRDLNETVNKPTHVRAPFLNIQSTF